MQSWDQEIIISNGKRKAYKYRKTLEGYGFRYDANRGRGCWILHTEKNRSKEKALRRFCKMKKLNITITNKNLTRGTGYRKEFFGRTNRNTYYCAYCGKRLKPSSMTVDHIVPVNKFKGNKSRHWLFLMGINDINEYKNLAPACPRCNKKKGAKGGLWIMRGFIGKHHYIRLTINVFKWSLYIAAFLFAAYCICRYYNIQILTN